MAEEKPEYIVRCKGAILCKEFDLHTAIDRAYEESETRPNEPVEVRSCSDSYPIFWRITHG
jgi:hypothetical protein